MMIDDQIGVLIGDLIRELRLRHGLTQPELANKLVSASGKGEADRAQVSRWELGRRIPARPWRKWLAVVLEIPVERLDRAAAVSLFVRAAPEDARDWAEYRRAAYSELKQPKETQK